MTEDSSPVILSVLNATDLRDRHCKLLVLANDQSRKLHPFSGAQIGEDPLTAKRFHDRLQAEYSR